MRKKIGELLVDAGAVTIDDVNAAVASQRSSASGQRLGELLVSMGKVTPTQVAKALSLQFDLPFIELPQIPSSVSAMVPVDFQSEHRIVPFRTEHEGKVERLHVAVADPTNLDQVDELRFQLGKPIRVFVAATDDIDEVLAALRGDGVAELAPLEIDEEPAEFAAPPLDSGALPEPVPAKPNPSVAPAPAPMAAGAPPDLPPEWDLSSTPPAASPPPAPVVSAKPAAAPGAAVLASTDLDDLLGGATARQSLLTGTQPPAKPALTPPAPQTRPAQVVRFDPPPRATPGAGTPAAAIPGASTKASPPAHLAATPSAPAASVAANSKVTPVSSSVAVSPPAPVAQAPAIEKNGTPTPEKPAIEFSEEDLRVLENLERLAAGEEPTLDSSKVKPAQMVASLIRLLMKKGVIGEAEFLEELGRK